MRPFTAAPGMCDVSEAFSAFEAIEEEAEDS
jgi:hypothetical protein